MSLLKVVVDTDMKSFSYNFMNPDARYADVEMLFSYNSIITNVSFGFKVFEDDFILKSFSFDEDFSYREFETSAYFNTVRIDRVNLNNLTFQFWCVVDEVEFSDFYNPDVNIPDKPFDSWVLSENGWAAPVDIPNDDFSYRWDEPSLSWVRVEWFEDLNEWRDFYE
jgi:hypothetical protein